MRANHLYRLLSPALVLSLALCTIALMNPVSPAATEEPKAPEAAVAQGTAPEAAIEAATEEAAPAMPEPERISGKLRKVDLEAKLITVLVEPDRNKTGRAYRTFKLLLDDKSLILINQQPAALSALAAGQLVEVGFFKKGKEQVVDTVVVTSAEE